MNQRIQDANAISQAATFHSSPALYDSGEG